MSVKRCIDFISEALVFCIVLRDNGLYITIHIGYQMQGDDLSVTFIITGRKTRQRWCSHPDSEVNCCLRNSNEGGPYSSNRENSVK